jgi:transcriptional regulator with XRE-family HTH domain
MAKTPPQTFGSVVRARRRQLNLTQEELASRIKSSVPYVGHLETSKRHPSEKIITRLAETLALESRELFFLANPETKRLISEPPQRNGTSAWEAFCKNDSLLKLHNITEEELQALSAVALLGDVRSPRDFMFILNTIRQALG